MEYVRIPDPVGQKYRLAEPTLEDLAGRGVTGIWMCTTQFTIEAYNKLCGKSNELTAKLGYPRDVRESPTYWPMPQRPVVNVSCDDVDVITASLNNLINVPSFYRLPTEFEWEWAAFGGEDFEYAGCTNWEKVAWFKPNSEGKAHPVGKKKANGYGLYDMSGNVWEWTSSNEGSNRVLRGGSWDFDPRYARVANRYMFIPSFRSVNLGFRLCFTELTESAGQSGR
jgi:formylglycine-generating enzyme required for sulfatase activity